MGRAVIAGARGIVIVLLRAATSASHEERAMPAPITAMVTGTSIHASAPLFCGAVSLWVLAVDNGPFWRLLWSQRDTTTSRGTLALLVLAGVLWLLAALALRLMCWGRGAKPVLMMVLLIAAVVAHFASSFGVLIDKGMLRNVLQTDWREASELLTPALAWDIAWRGLLPAAVVAFVAHRPIGAHAATLATARHAVAAALCAAAAAALFFADYAAIARNHREARHLLTPSNVANAIWGLWKDHSRPPQAIVPIAADASRAVSAPGSRPLLVVLVVGETARAANFSMAGYRRPTNQALVERQAAYVGTAMACGTDTATSLPCMFSNLGSRAFTIEQAQQRENALDVLARVGVGVTWIDNNSGCKGVCARVPTVHVSEQAGAACTKDGCLDEALVEVLVPRLAKMKGDTLVVLHMRGSHGPAYYLRHPAKCMHYQPTCDTAQLQSCSGQALLNSYDNSVTYTSEVLADVIDLLAAASDRLDSVLLYVSDHGESLGEGGVFLHGLPKWFAPREQVEVPVIAWASPGSRRLSVADAARRLPAAPPRTHDEVFHTLLGAFGVRTAAYRPDLDLFAAAVPSGSSPQR